MNHQLKSIASISPLMLILLVVASLRVQGQEKRISTKDLPAEVRSAFEKSYPNAQIKGAAREVEKGITYYEIESMDGATRRDLLYAEDGTLSEIEEEVDTALLPEAVKKSLDEEFPKYTIRKAEKTTHGSSSAIEVVLEKGKRRYEVILNQDGKIQKKEALKMKSGKKEDKEKKDEDNN